jgi:transposase-like protein
MSNDFDVTLERKLESNTDGRIGCASEVRRVELIMGTGRRRRWSRADKARIVADSLEGGVSVSEVARRNGLSPQQLFGWRREARALFQEGGSAAPADRSAANPALRLRRGKGGQLPSPEVCDDRPGFAPVVIAASARSSPLTPSQPSSVGSGTIEIAIDDAVVRVIGQVESPVLVTVLRAVRRASS